MIAEPMAGPAAAPTPPNDDVMPNAVARRDGGTSRSAIAVVAVISTADARPMSVRPAMMRPTPLAVAHITDPRRNTTTPHALGPLAPGAIGDDAAEHQRRARHHRVRVEHPRQRALPDVGKARWISG